MQALQALLETAVGLGVSLVDTADVYGAAEGRLGWAEELLGDVLAASPGLRSRIVVATKAGVVPGRGYDSSRSHLMRACDESLARLRIDVIDLFQVHRPDLFADPDEVAEALSSLVEAGKVRVVGVSNYTPGQLGALAARLRVPLASTSPELSLLHLETARDGSLEKALELGLTVLAWSPLADGALASGDGVRPALLAELDRLATREGVERGAIALAFLLSLPGRVVPIVGTTTPARLVAAAAATRVALDRADLYRLVEAADGTPLP